MEEILKKLERIERAILSGVKDEIIDVDEVVRITGLKKNTIYAYHKKEDLPSYKFGDRSLRFKRAEVIEWMNSRIIKNV